MSSLVVVGAQWGDEGKGKVTDYLAAQAHVVVRYQGGNNAGHTVVAGGQTFRLHLIPSGAIHPGVCNVIGNGVVVDPNVLLGELEELERCGVGRVQLYISERAHVIMPYHRLLDRLEEEKRGDARIGTTGRGIGPVHVDKVARSGIRMVDLVDASAFRARLAVVLPTKNELLRGLYGHVGYTVNEIVSEYEPAATRLAPYVTDTSLLVHQALDSGQRVLFEGAQGTLLDVDHGTYPFVTSSSATAGGASIGTGVGPKSIDTVLGVVKAYSTRVGEGPFPSELMDSTGEIIRKRGQEFGTTTGRPRRCGWFDAVVGRYAARVNGLQEVAVTKLDVLSGLPEVKMCVAYTHRGEILQHFPVRPDVLSECEPVYESMPGWSDDLTKISSYRELPSSAKAYLERLSQVMGTRIALVSVGPDREQTIACHHLFHP